MGIEGVLTTRQMVNAMDRIQDNKVTPIKQIQENQGEEKNQNITVTKEKLAKQIESVNQFLKTAQTSIRFQLHDKLQEYYVQIIDENTKEVIKEIPPKKFLDMYANIMEQIGLIIDHRI
ncbi:flagellar protein FlaG [Tepidibacillus sp. LV47]|uniref:flagellar protein FlaG n=1 Tax=Tepidibacillus sp. LV47 TaxID=3398228 RepID=UPI003AB00201